MSWENAYQPYQPQQESSGKAMAALILGICGLVVCPLVCSILAIVFANQAHAEIDASRGRLGGRQNAQVGLILGWVGVALVVVGVLLVLAVVALAASSGGDYTYSVD
jgi:small-conductance mechanosensitive channel